MGTYAVTGGSSGIGAKTVQLLKQKGHDVLNVDLRGGDITADLSTLDGRQHVIDELHRLCPDGLDGLVCNAGVSSAYGNLKLIVSLNFFGTVVLIKGAYALLKKNTAHVLLLLPTPSHRVRHVWISQIFLITTTKMSSVS